MIVDKDKEFCQVSLIDDNLKLVNIFKIAFLENLEFSKSLF